MEALLYTKYGTANGKQIRSSYVLLYIRISRGRVRERDLENESRVEYFS